MTIGVTTTTQIAPLPRTIIDRTMLVRALDYLPHALFAQTKQIPQNSGDQPTFTVFDSLPIGVLLSEGVNPEPYQLSRSSVATQLIEMGAYVTITDWAQYVNQDKIQIEARQLLGESAGKTLDTYIRDVLAAGTSVYRADAVGSRGAVNTVPDADDLDTIILALRNNNAEPFTEIINPSTGIGTTPIPDAYWAITTFSGADVLRSALGTAWTPVQNYPSQAGVQRNEVGAYRNIRFIATTNGLWYDNAGASSKDVHCAIILGKNAYGLCPLSGKSLENIEHSPAEIGGPLNRYGTSGYVMRTAALILNQNFMYRYEFTLS